MKKCSLLLMLLLVFCLSACVKPASICDGVSTDTSTICKIANDSGIRLETVGNIFIIANLAAVESGVYNKDESRLVFLSVLELVESYSSYLAVSKLIQHKVKKYPGLFIVADSYLAAMDNPGLITDFDRELLAKWLNKQLASIGVF